MCMRIIRVIIRIEGNNVCKDMNTHSFNNNSGKQKQTCRYREQSSGYQTGSREGEMGNRDQP